MLLLPLRSAADFDIAADWLRSPENSQWLDFGSELRVASPTLLRVMAQRESNCMRLYAAQPGDAPMGIVGLNNVDRGCGTGTLWGVAGDKSFRNRGYAQLAASRLLELAFGALELNAVNTWTVDGNPSYRSVERLGFRFVGLLRECHRIDGCLRDRLLFDLLATEFRAREEKVRLPLGLPATGAAQAVGPVAV
jgi:RimJ/RimL family protein N-acetyltransferase